MIKWLKSLFKEKEVVLKNEDINAWFEDITKKRFDKFYKKVDSLFEDIRREVDNAKNALKDLELAELKNDKIGERERSFMTGNRQNYVKQVSIFLDNVFLPDSRDVKKFIMDFDPKIEQLNKSSAKSHMILQEFFAHESSAVAKSIKNVDDLVKEIKDLVNDKDFDDIEVAKKQIAKLKNNILLQQELGSKKNELEEKKNRIGQQFEKTSKSLDLLENTKGFKQLQDLKQELKDMDEKINKVDDELLQMFSGLDRAFKKYEKQGYEFVDVVRAYSDPLVALIKDEGLRVLECLRNIKISVMKGDLDFKEDEKQKIIKRINAITSDKLETFQLAYKHFKEKKEELARIYRSDETLYTHKELHGNKEHLEKQLDKMNNEFQRTSNELSTIDLEEQRVKLEQSLSYISGIVVRLER